MTGLVAMVYEPLYHALQMYGKRTREVLGAFLFPFQSSFPRFWGVFNKTIIPLALVGYEMIIATRRYASRWLSMIKLRQHWKSSFGATQASGSAVNFDKVMTKFIINKWIDAEKTDVNLFFTTTRPQNSQMLRINLGKRPRKLAVNKDKWMLFKITRTSFSRFLIGYLKKSLKSHWLKNWQFVCLKLNLKACIN